MTNQSTIDKLIEMRLTSMADAFRNQLDDPKFKEIPFEDQFGMLVDIEYSSRKNNRLVFCKHFLEKNAKYFWRMLHLQIGEYCKAWPAATLPAAWPLQTVFNCYSVRYEKGSSEFSSLRACSLK